MSSFKERYQYKFDNLMSKGTRALVLLLGAFAVALIIIVTSIMAVNGLAPAGMENPNVVQLMWTTFLHTVDSGSMSGEGGHPMYLAVMFLATLGGIFLVSTLIGVINNGIDARLTELRKGRSKVIEDGHTVILGWSPMIFSIISELVEANQNHRGRCIAILAEKDKVEMEDEIHAHIPDTHSTKIVCRSGNPIDLTDLEIVNPHSSRSIIILSPDDDNSDAQVIKTILAITNNPRRRERPYHIVAGLQEERNLDVASMVGKTEVELVAFDDLLSKITAQTCRQSGLSVVYTELLDFAGDEIYMQEFPALTGMSFRDAVFMFEQSAVIGICDVQGTTSLNPSPMRLLSSGDKIVAVTSDDDSFKVSETRSESFSEEDIAQRYMAEQHPEATLILGWNRRGINVLAQLDRYVAPGSEAMVVSDFPAMAEELNALAATLKRLEVRCQTADTTHREILDALQCERFDHIILLTPADIQSTQEADARTLITLLHLRDIAENAGRPFTIVSEMLDVRNRELADVTQADDFIVSNKIESLLFSQIAENKHLGSVFKDLFDADGSEIYLKPASDYVRTDVPVTFYTVLESALRKNETAIGYRIRSLAGDVDKQYGVKLNPVKNDPISFALGDCVIVLSDG